MKNIFLILASVSLNAAAQLFMRKGMLKVGEVSLSAGLFKALPAMAGNGFLWLALACYGVSILTWMVVLGDKALLLLCAAYIAWAAGIVLWRRGTL
jgi:hypothetical protein